MRFSPINFRGRELGPSNEESPYQKSDRQADELTKIAAQYISKEKDNSAAYGRAIIRTANRFLSAKSLKELNGGVRLYGYSEMLPFFLTVTFGECPDQTDAIREVFLAELEKELGTKVVERYENRLQGAFNQACQAWEAFVMENPDLIAQKFSEAKRNSDDNKWIDISEIQGKQSRINVMLSERAFKERDSSGDGVLLVYYRRFWGTYKKLGSFYTRQGHSNGSPIVDRYDERYIEEFLRVNTSTIATHVFGRQKAVELTGGTGFEPESAPAPGGTGTEPIAAMAPAGREDADLVAEPTRMPDATGDFVEEQGKDTVIRGEDLGAKEETEDERLRRVRNALNQEKGGRE